MLDYTNSTGEITVDTTLNKVLLHDGSVQVVLLLVTYKEIFNWVRSNKRNRYCFKILHMTQFGGTITLDDNVTISGNLTVSGTTTTVIFNNGWYSKCLYLKVQQMTHTKLH